MNELMTIEHGAMPLMSLQEAAQRRQALVDFTAKIMKDGFDYGMIPGTNKNTLLKPGAEKLTTFFGLSPAFEIVDSVTDWTGAEHGDEPFFYFAYRCTLRRGDVVAGEGDGSCNSWEKKYRYRKGGRTCPNCGADAIIKGRAEYGGGWLCFAKKGGCGSKWADGAQEIEGQNVGQVKNDNPADLVNTIQKMAQKRALVAATLIAVNASEFFTQDMEDYVDIIEAEFVETKPEPEAPKQAANGNGKQERPLSAAALKQAMAKKTAGDDGSPPSEKQLKYAVACLSVITTGDNDRYDLTEFLFGVRSAKDLSKKQCSAVIDWVGYVQSGDDWIFSEDAKQEAARAIRQFAKEQGQGELFPEEQS